MGDHRSETHGVGEIRKTSVGSSDRSAHTLSSQTWSSSSNTSARPGLPSEVAAEDTAMFDLFPEPALAFILKMAASLLQPGCLGGSPVMLPVHLQGAAGADTHVSRTQDTSVTASCPSSVSLPLILDQSLLQYISSHLLAQSSCLIPEQQCHQNPLGPGAVLRSASTPLSQPRCSGAKSNPSPLPLDSPASQTAEFTAALQELYSTLKNRGTRSPADPVSETFFHPESALPCLHPSFPLVSLIPPATLLVPYPLLVPLPVPLPIPIPIPIPVSDTTKSKSTHIPKSDYYFLQLPTRPPPSLPQEEVLDLSVKFRPVQTQRHQCPIQDSALDLSVSGTPFAGSCGSGMSKYHVTNSTNVERDIRPLTYSQRRVTCDTDVEFGSQYEWTMEVEHLHRKSTTRQAGHSGRDATLRQRPTADISVQDSLAVTGKIAINQPKDYFHKNKIKQLKRAIPQSINTHPVKKRHAMTFQPG
ncbi:retinoic acid-induced protein 2-like isoform X2 [Brachyhypopomus gauderio]